MSKAHVLFYEPTYSQESQYLWDVRGGYKYASIIGNLAGTADITILMSRLPPADDRHRKNLENNFGIRFCQLQSLDIAIPGTVQALAQDLVRSFRKAKPTIVSNLNGRAVGYCYAAGLAARRSGAEYVLRLAGNDIEVRGNVAESRGEPYWGTDVHLEQLAQERAAAWLAKRVIVMTKKEMIRVSSICDDPDKIHICYRGVDQSLFYPAGETPPICRRFLFVGRRSHEKGFDILELAADKLAATGADVQVSFVGNFEEGVIGNRSYLGYVRYEDLPALYRSHDALVVCSRSEGFPQVVMEAMSCGLPCVLPSRIFENDFCDGDGCLLVETDPDSVAAAIARLRESPELFAALRARSVTMARNQFSEGGNRKLYQNLLLN